MRAEEVNKLAKNVKAPKKYPRSLKKVLEEIMFNACRGWMWTVIVFDRGFDFSKIREQLHKLGYKTEVRQTVNELHFGTLHVSWELNKQK